MDSNVYSVSGYLDLVNDTLQMIPSSEVVIEGEVSDFRIAQQKWISFDLKDEKEDKRNGLLTLPVILGKEKTLTLLKPIIFLVSFFLPLLLSIITNQKFFFYLSSLVFIDLMSWFLVKKNNYQAYFLQASQFLFWLILLLIVKII